MTTTVVFRSKWEISPSKEQLLFTHDQLIDAYLKGKKVGYEQQQTLLLSKLEENITKVNEKVIKVIKYLSEKKTDPQSINLKINSWDSFEIILVIPEERFLAEDFVDTYDFINSLEEEDRDDLFNIRFSFLDASGEYDDRCLQSDGYVLQYKM